MQDKANGRVHNTTHSLTDLILDRTGLQKGIRKWFFHLDPDSEQDPVHLMRLILAELR